VPRELAEMALAHKIESATEAAYQRSDALLPRRALMQRWAKFPTGGQNRKEEPAAA
jgi:hypothetical protein